jgi:RNA 3'-terminal phosphate cyclase (ATP)
MAPQYDYWELVLLPILERFGLSSDQIQASVVRRGFFPRGGGEVHVQVKACRTELLPISLTDRGEVKEIYIRSFHAGTLGRHLAVQMASACKAFLKPRVHSTINWNEEIVTESSAIGNGLGLLVTAKTSTGCILAGSTLCKPKQTAKDAGEAAANELWEALSAGGCVDQWLQDQLIVFMALANGESEMLTGSLTLHTQTAITVAEELTNAKFIVERLSDDAERPAPRRGSKKYNESGCIHGQHLVRCKGQGFSPFGFSKRVDSKLL